MILTNQQIVDCFEKLDSLRKDASVRFPASASYAIIHNIRVLAPLVQDIERVRLELIQQNSETSQMLDNGLTEYHIKSDMVDSVNKQLDEFWKLENDVAITSVPYSHISGLDLSLAAMDALYPMICMDSE